MEGIWAISSLIGRKRGWLGLARWDDENVVCGTVQTIGVCGNRRRWNRVARGTAQEMEVDLLEEEVLPFGSAIRIIRSPKKDDAVQVAIPQSQREQRQRPLERMDAE
jgi:hypothetical protein